MISSLLRFALPALLLGALGGFFIGSTLERGPARKSLSAVEFEQPVDGQETPEGPPVRVSLDERRWARLCAEAALEAERLPTSRPRSGVVRGRVPSEEELDRTRKSLNYVLSLVQEKGEYTQEMGRMARAVLQHLPEDEVREFARTIEDWQARGQLSVQAGAWLPPR